MSHKHKKQILCKLKMGEFEKTNRKKMNLIRKNLKASSADLHKTAFQRQTNLEKNLKKATENYFDLTCKKLFVF